jgi:hypothetical protein
LIFFAGGTFFFVMMVREAVKDWTMEHWPTAPCTILTSTAGPDGSGYAAKFRYRYDFAGKSHIGNLYRKGYTGSNDFQAADKLTKAYAAGTNRTCHVNPANADEAVLDVEAGWTWLAMLWFPAIFMAIGGGGAYFVWFGRDKRKALSDSGKPISEKVIRRSGLRVGIALLALAFIGGASWSVLWAFPTIQKFATSESWPATPCKVISSRVQSHESNDNSTTYSVDILYSYKVNGQEFKSSRYDFIGGSSSGAQSKREIVSHYHAGKMATCYVNPNNPSEAVLSPGWNWKALLLLFPLGLTLVGAGGLIGIYRSQRRKQSDENIWALKRAGGATGTTVTSQAAQSVSHSGFTSTTATLKPAQTARSKFIILLIFAVIWEGGLAIFFRSWWTSGAQFELCGGVFASFFYVVGVIIIIALIYSGLALVNPTAEIDLSPSQLPLGTKATVSWRMKGRTDRISKLTIRLEGREEARYRRGTSTYTDRNVFAIIPVVETTSAIEIGRGEVSFTIPHNTMHSFQAPNNKIIWEIKLRGEIARWPDVITEYPLQVLPAEVQA